VSVIADAYLAGVSTRRVETLVRQLGVERLSKSQASRLAKSLDELVEDFRTRPLVARGFRGVRLVTSDAHPGLVDAIQATLPAAAWQRCRRHFMRNLLTRVRKSAQAFVATMVRTIFAQPDADTVAEQHTRIVAARGFRPK
jgi:transposase-like protein